jgi:hypothetical protein
MLMVEHGERPLFSEAALDALDSSWDEARRYAAALAALAGDRRAHTRLVERVRKEMPPRLDLSRVDDLVVCQAVASHGDLDELDTTFQTYSSDNFRLPYVSAIAAAAGDSELAGRADELADRFTEKRPDTKDLNSWRASLAQAALNLNGSKELRAAPTTLSFLYGAMRTIVAALDRSTLLHVVSELEQRSVFWPADLTAETLDSTLRRRITPSDLTGLLEMADRCGLAVDLVDAVSARASTHLSVELAAGIRRIEGLLFPYARTSVERSTR